VVAADWTTVEDLQQENLVQEVSELVHRRLVSTALQGEFRNVLELHVRVCTAYVSNLYNLYLIEHIARNPSK